MDAEAIRDAILAVSGRLDQRLGGPASAGDQPGSARRAVAKGWRLAGIARSESNPVAVFTCIPAGSLLAPLMTTFDFCDTTLPCGQARRERRRTPGMALLNGAFAHEQSQAMAAPAAVSRARRRPLGVVRRRGGLVLARSPNECGRPPRPVARPGSPAAPFQEDRRADDLALASLCHVLINCNEFIFVD